MKTKLSIQIGQDTPHLSIENPLYKNAIKEIEQYSVTPTTFKARVFFNKDSDLIKKDSKLQPIKQKIHDLKNIQQQQQLSQEQSKQLNGLESYEKFLGQGLQASDIWFKDTYEYKTNFVERYGISVTNMRPQSVAQEGFTIIDPKKDKAVSVATAQYKIEDAKARSHHSLEKFLIQSAVDDLLASQSKNIVLVDIFGRDGSGKLKLEENGQMEIHTVALYKNSLSQQGKYEILVIDPSNFAFSSHIASTDIADIIGINSEIKVLHSDKLQIYKPNGGTGLKLSQYRDCIDIAVKLAFGLNIEKPQFNLAEAQLTNSIKDSASIKEVTNQQKCYQPLPDILSEYPVRAKQSSDIVHRKEVTLYSKILGEELKKIQDKIVKSDFYNLKDADYLGKLSQEVFGSNLDHEHFITSMHNRYTEIISNDLIGLELGYIKNYEEQ